MKTGTPIKKVLDAIPELIFERSEDLGSKDTLKSYSFGSLYLFFLEDFLFGIEINLHIGDLKSQTTITLPPQLSKKKKIKYISSEKETCEYFATRNIPFENLYDVIHGNLIGIKFPSRTYLVFENDKLQAIRNYKKL